MDAEKALDQIKYLFMIKTFYKVGIEGVYFNIMIIYDKLTDNTQQ